MGTHRRQFMKTASMFAIGLGMPTIGARIAQAGTSTMSANTPSGAVRDILTKDAFTPHLNSNFRIRDGFSTVNARLVNVTDVKATAKKPSAIKGREAFSLMFQSSKRTKELRDNVYKIEHAKLGTFSMFLVAVGRDEKVRNYEAIISRL